MAEEFRHSYSLSMAKMLRCRVRYFSDGAVIGSKGFVNDVLEGARERFSEKRKDGAKKCEGMRKLRRELCGACGICG